MIVMIVIGVIAAITNSIFNSGNSGSGYSGGVPYTVSQNR